MKADRDHDLSAVLGRIRRDCGLSLAELAAAVRAAGGDISRAGLHHYETGERSPPAARLAEIARATGFTIAVTSDGRWAAKRNLKKLSPPR
jgi:transcriptional regulator with XRE-family HTH domain